MKKSAWLIGAAVPLVWTAIPPAAAQEAPTRGASVERGDIVVTARRRQESILDVPVVETVLSADVMSGQTWEPGRRQ